MVSAQSAMNALAVRTVRALVVIMLIQSFFAAAGGEQWKVLFGQVTSNPMMEFAFFNSTLGFGVGNKFEILQWDGRIWSLDNSTISSTGLNVPQLSSVAFYNSSLAFAVGGEYDGPAPKVVLQWNGSWHNVSALVPNLSSFIPHSISCLENEECVIVGSAGYAAKWNGSEWSRLPTAPVGLGELRTVKLINSTLGFAGGFVSIVGSPSFNIVFKWNGSEWSNFTANLSSASDVILKMHFLNSSFGFAIAGSAEIYFYNGTNFTPHARPSLMSALYDVLIVNTTLAFVAGEHFFANSSGLLVFNGTNWTQANLRPPSSFVYSVGFINSTFGFLSTDLGLIYQYNSSNASWFVYGNSIVESAHLIGVSFLNSSIGFAKSSRGDIIFWNGSTWKLYTRFLSLSIGRTYVINSTFAFALSSGFNGINTSVYFWNGSNWTMQTVLPQTWLVDAAFYNASLGFVVGGNSSIIGPERPVIYQWNGTNWTRIPSSMMAGLTYNTPRGIAFANSSKAFISTGDWLLTWNGTTWERDKSNLTTKIGGLRGPIKCVNSTLCFVGLQKTSENNLAISAWNGSNWYEFTDFPQEISEMSGLRVEDFAFSSPKFGYAILGTSSPANYILKYNGTNWTLDILPVKAHFNSIAFTGNGSFHIVGQNGVILEPIAYAVLGKPSSVKVTLASDETQDLTRNFYSTVITAKLLKVGEPVAEFQADFSSDRNFDWSDLIADVDNASGKSVVHIPPRHLEIDRSNITLYVPKGNSTQVRVCPNATSLAEVNSTCSNGFVVVESSANVSVSRGYWKLTGLSGTGAISESPPAVQQASKPREAPGSLPETPEALSPMQIPAPTIASSPTPTLPPVPTVTPKRLEKPRAPKPSAGLQQAAEAITEAKTMLARAQALGAHAAAAEARELIELAQQALENNDAPAAQAYANKARQVLEAAAVASTQPMKARVDYWPYFAAVAAALAVLVLVAALTRGKTRSRTT